MQTNATALLKRLRSFEEGDGIRRAKSLSRILFVIGLLLSIFVGYAIAYRLHPALIAVAAVVVGFVIAERNALRSRISRWPIFRGYIDWQRVREDLKRDV
jgi:hypothetical protein